MALEENKRLRAQLHAYMTELENQVTRIENSDFPFPDIAPVYAEVVSRIRSIMEEGKPCEA